MRLPIILITTLLGLGGVHFGTTVLAAEPSYMQAVVRWPDMRKPVTFLGCKDHPDEFAMMWNGNLTLFSLFLADSKPVRLIDADMRLFQNRIDDSLQVSFSIAERPSFENRDVEDGSAEPSLADSYLPITRVRHKKEGAVVLEEAFVSDEDGGGKAAAWNTPVFLRMRFTVEEPGTGTSPIQLWAQLAKNHTSYGISMDVRVDRVAPIYARKLRQEGSSLLDSRGLVRLYTEQGLRFYPELPETVSSLALREFQLNQNVCQFSLPRKLGAGIELIIPFLPVSEEKIASVRRMTYEQARQSVAKFWKDEIARGMQVEVPEEPLNNLWRFSVPSGFITADVYPNGEHVMKVSPHWYEGVWAVGNAMHLPELIQRGYRQEVAAFLDPYLDAKRRRPVPNDGVTFSLATGFISPPSEYSAVSWLSDHGAILWTASEYFLLTRDQEFLGRWLPALLEGVEWIARERAITELRGGIDAGLMPPSRSTDDPEMLNLVFNDAWTYRGLAGVCRVLKQIGHKDLARWEQERDAYRATFQKVFRGAVQRTIRWTDGSGIQIPFIPWDLKQTNADKLHIFYLDAGPLFAGVTGLLDPNDEIITWALRWLTEGPYSKTYNPNGNSFAGPPSLYYELATSEPHFSWNIPLRFLRNERENFLEGFYSLSAGSVSRRFLVGYEERNGVPGYAMVNAAIAMHLRNMLVFENEAGQGLDLLRNSPSTWLEGGKHIRVQRAETYFGQVSYTVRSMDGERIEAEIESPDRDRLAWIRLHLHAPNGKPLYQATVNGVAISALSGNVLEIKNPIGVLKVVARY